MRPEKPHAEIAAANPRRGGAVLVMVLVACLLVLSGQAQVRGGRGTVLQSWILSLSAPVASAAGALSRGVSTAISSTLALFHARAENERLRRDLDARERELFRLRAETRQSADDHRMLGAGASLPGVVGTVPILLIERRAGVQSALIGAGSTDGVVAGSALAVPAGLVGRVVTVGRGVSRAQLLLDTSAAAGARIARTGALGVVRGDGHGALVLNNIATTSSVVRGDLVESAGIDGIYPRGVPIGRVESVSRGGKLFLEIRVVPTADFSRLTDVLLLAPSLVAKESAEPERNTAR